MVEFKDVNRNRVELSLVRQPPFQSLLHFSMVATNGDDTVGASGRGIGGGGVVDTVGKPAILMSLPPEEMVKVRNSNGKKHVKINKREYQIL